PGLAFVILSHLPRDLETSLAEILSRYTTMPVLIAKNNTVVQRNHVYVCPPSTVCTINNGKLRARNRSSEAQHKPIDVFMSSLADDCGERAIGIVLSGGGTDGALGIKAIKERGGLTLAQVGDGTGPIHSSMPESAIASGVVDLELPVEEMPARLTDY